MSREISASVVMVCGPSTNGEVRRVDEICSRNTFGLGTAEDTIFALTPEGVYDVFTLTLAVNSEAKAVAGGTTHNVLLSAEGDMYSWGTGQWGELGLGPKNVDMESPGQVRCAAKVTAIACGDSHTCAVDTFGNVYAWGQNFSRQLGLYKKKKSEMPANCMVEEMVMTPRILPFSVINSVSKVACGWGFTMAVTKSGQLWTWGAGESGQLGTGRCTIKEVPSECVLGEGNNTCKVIDVACGYGHAGAVTSTGTLYTWGLNKHGQLGNGTNTTVHDPTPISLDGTATHIYAHYNSSACITSDGALFTWGAGTNFRLMHGDCLSSYSPRKVEALSMEKTSAFIFSTNASAALIKTRLYSVSPKIGMLKNFNSLDLAGCGFWPSSTIVVKFTKCSDPSQAVGDDDNPAAVIPPRSCVGQLISPGVISCKPPRLTTTGYYDVTMSMDGKNFLHDSSRVFVCTDPVVLNIENTLYDIRDSDKIDIVMTCSGLDDIGPGIDVFVRLVNADDPDIFSPPLKAELLPEEDFLFDADGHNDSGIGDDQLSLGASVSDHSLAQPETGHADDKPAVPKRRIMCRDVEIKNLKNISGATLMLKPQLSRNARDFAAPASERIICHAFTPSNADPNCVPFSSQREIVLRGSGFFPLGLQASIAITTVIDAVPIEEVKKKKNGKKNLSRGPSVSQIAQPPSPVLQSESALDGGPSTTSVEDLKSVLSMASIGSAILESESPAFHAMTVPVRFDSISELAITIPALVDFLRPGLKLPSNTPSVISAKIMFALASDAAAALSKTELDFFFYREDGIEIKPKICRRNSGQVFSITGVNNWMTFESNAPKLIFSNREADFIKTVDVTMQPADIEGTYQIVFELPNNQPKQVVIPNDGEPSVDAPNPMIFQSESSLEQLEIPYNSLEIGLLLDGVTPPDQKYICSVQIFDEVTILDLANPLPKDGAQKGASVAFNAKGLVPSDSCVVRLRGVNNKYVEVRGVIPDAISEESGQGTITFQMPDSLEDVEVNVKGKEKSVFVDISIDGGATFDQSELPLLPVKY